MTQKSLTDALNEAAAAVADSKVPDDLREVAFSKALDSLLEVGEEQRAGGEHALPEVVDAGAEERVGSSPIAKRLLISDTVAAKVFDVDDDGVHLLLPSSAFSSQKKQATQDVAILVAAGRQAVGLEEWTATTEIRTVAEKKGVLDAKNFAKRMNELDGHGLRLRGDKPTSREIKLNDAGFESAGSLANKLTGQE